ncbi:MAG: glycosyltransferase [Nitrospira sp. CR2.1]|nr:glycosyltransferase [Nitrospira sp. CR2.1]MBA5874303.1 glycosyltransferase [Nitrospira sp. CR1.2]
MPMTPFTSIRVMSNLRRLDGIEAGPYKAESQYAGEKETFWDGLCLFFRAQGKDVLVLTGGTWRVVGFCLMKTLWPLGRCKVVAVDFILSRPNGWKQSIIAWLKGQLLRKVDRFILHFKDTSEYERLYGIPSSKCVFVPFKVNYWEKIASADQPPCTEEYVFTAGRSYRDFPTFIEAMRRVDYPGLLLYEDAALLKRSATDVDLSNLPRNLATAKNEGERSWVEFIRRAKIVVVPLLPSTMYAPGLSLYLMAMALGKCVVVTEGLATRGMLGDEAVTVAPQDAAALAEAIRRLWTDDALRHRTAEKGRRYAERCGGEARLLADIVQVCGQLCMASRLPKDHSLG